MSDEKDEGRIEPTAARRDDAGTVEVRTGGEPPAERIELPPTLPVLPLKNTVLFPALLAPLLVNTARSQRLIDQVLVSPDRLMLAAAVRRPVEGSPGPDDVYRTGTVLRVARMMKFPDGSYRLLVQGVARARIDEFTVFRERTVPALTAAIAFATASGSPRQIPR